MSRFCPDFTAKLSLFCPDFAQKGLSRFQFWLTKGSANVMNAAAYIFPANKVEIHQRKQVIF